MVRKLYGIKDSKAEVIDPIFASVSVGSAVRQFVDLCLNDKTFVGQHYKDFALVALGEYDDNTGVITPAPSVIVVEDGEHARQPELPLATSKN